MIIISGHGNKLGIVDSSGGGISPPGNPKLGTSESLAQVVGDYLTENGVIIFASCEVGNAKNGLQRWANFTGHDVIATPGDVSTGVTSTMPWIIVEPEFEEY